jgi:hypothetical protein
MYPSSTAGDFAIARVMLGIKPRLAWSMSKNFLLVPVALGFLRDGMRWVFILCVYIFGGCLGMSGREFFGIGQVRPRSTLNSSAHFGAKKSREVFVEYKTHSCITLML